MNKLEVNELLKKVQAYRQSFLITKTVISEWIRILEPYDSEDVNDKLDVFFKNGDNFGKYPDAYYLTKYLKRHDEKLKVGVNYCRCQICGTLVDLQQYDGHYDRCSSADYLCRMSQKHYNKKLNKDKMMASSKEEFDKYYWKFCEGLIEILDDGLEKHLLKNAILTHYKMEPEYGIEKITKEMSDKW